MLKSLRRKQLITTGTSVIILACIGLTAYFFARSSKIISQADVILANKDLSNARAFVNANYPEELLLGISQMVKARHENVRQFISTDEEVAAALLEKINTIESSKGEWSDDLHYVAFAYTQLKALNAPVEELSYESARPLRLELDRLENELLVFRNEFARALIAQAESVLYMLEDEIVPQLSLSQAPGQLLNAVESVTKALDILATIEARGQGVVSITEDQSLRKQFVTKSMDAALAAIKAHNDFTEKLLNISSIEAYYKVISAGMTIDYIGSPYSKHLLDAPKRFDEIGLRKVAFRELPKALVDLQAGDSLPPLSPPSSLLPKEVDAYADFRFNEMVEDIQMHEVVVPRPKRTVRMYSKGDIKDAVKFSGGGDLMRAYINGSLYYPHIEKGQIKFNDYENQLVSGLNSYGYLPEMKMFEAFGVDKLLSSQREVIQSESNPAPFLRLIDQIRDDKTISIDFRCYLIIQLFTMMEASERPEQWGLSYLPNWKTEVRALKNLGIQNGDWLRESSSGNLASAEDAIVNFFDAIPLESLSRVSRGLVSAISKSKVKYYGYIGGEDYQFKETLAFARSQASGGWVKINGESPLEDYDRLSPIVSVTPDLSETFSQVCAGLYLDADMTSKIANYLKIQLD
jgi:hypothetical protein